ncbi:MAG: TraB/GumN family protein [Kiritimatiellaceae bacterium]|nr:TraB/GumN family protein [Kiritimatiellaceae bacterium]
MKPIRISLIIPFILCAQALAESSVWKAEKEGSILYLGGTCHLLRASDFPLPPEFETAYRAADSLIFETDIGKMKDPDFQMQLMTQATYTDGSTLADHLSAPVYNKLNQYCSEQQIPLAMLSTFKPSLVGIFILTTELSKLGVTQEGADHFLYAKAKSENKTVRGLETLQQQLQFIVNMGKGKEDAMILQMLDDVHTIKQDYEEIVGAWKSGNTNSLNQLMNLKIKETYPEIYKELIVDRNHNWFPVIDACQKTPETEFILVGAAHLVGPDSLIEMLKKSGYTVEKL